MKHHLLVAALLAVSAQAGAQIASYCPSYPTPVAPPVAIVKDMAAPPGPPTPADLPLYACAPGPNGTGVGLTVRGNTAGAVAWWYCPDHGSYGISFGAATWDKLAGAGLVEKLLKAANAPDAKEALDEFTRANISTPIGDPTLTPVWCPFWPAMWAGRPAPVPVPAWVVATPSLGTAQRTYTVTSSGALLGDGKKAEAGTACDCTAQKLVRGASTYCNVPPLTGVALCVQRP